MAASQPSKFGGGGSGGGWLKDVGVRTVQAFSRRRQAGRTPSSFTNCAGVRLSLIEVRRSRCTPHKMPRLGRRADRQKKTASKSCGRKNAKSPGRQAGGRVQRWLSRRGKAAAIVTTTFSVVDWQADTWL